MKMKINFILFIITGLFLTSCVSKKEESSEANGKIIHIDAFPSRIIKPRAIDIWLPSDYDSSKQYAVIYMHDGQMLFDSTTTWNNKVSQADETMTRLLKEQKIKDAIVVGIHNDVSRREADYFPEAALEYAPAEVKSAVLNKLGGDVSGDEYLMFIVLELRPYIDSAYSVHNNQANTFMIGSSMGGLISLYALCEYPMIFGGVGCISTHWPLNGDTTNNLAATFRQYIDDNLPPPENHKIYFDYGTETLDSLYKPHQILVDSIMIRHSYSSSSWITKEFPGDEHSEVAWSKRLHHAIEFLLGKK